MKTTIFLLLALPLAAQNIAPKDSERDPVLTALLEAESTSELPAVIVDLSSPLAGSQALSIERPLPREVRGVSVAVEPGSSTTPFKASEIKLLAPFPAKPLSNPPAGWKLVQPDQVPPIARQADLANGTQVPLSIRPHLLVPDADGENVLALLEPGYDPGLQYAQKHTMGSILADSIIGIDETSERLSAATERLEQLLSSLPAPAPRATPITPPIEEP